MVTVTARLSARTLIVSLAVGLVAILAPLIAAAPAQAYIVCGTGVQVFVLETFLWRTPFAQASLQMSAAEAEATAILAGNQGVYNAVFAAGLGWSLWSKKQDLLRFFLVSIVAVGVYGAVSARVMVFVLDQPLRTRRR